MRICRKNRLTIALVALLQCQGYGDCPQGPTPALAQGLVDVDPVNARPRRPQPLPRARSPRPPPADDTEARRSQAPTGSEVNRSILALYDGAEESEASETRIHKQLELPLNHLGYRVTYWDLRSGLPPLAEARRHKAIATWFGERIPNPRAYLDWARGVAQARVRFVIMDFVGADGEDRDLAGVNALLGHIGLAVRSGWVEPSPDLRVVVQRDATIGSEYGLAGKVPGYMMYKPVKPDVRSHVVVARPGEDAGRGSHPVVTGPGGGFAAAGFTIHYDEKGERLSWVIDPFAFLSEALDSPLVPIPDTTTLVGRRIYFSHIDGDGWNSVSLIPRVDQRGKLVSEVVMDDLVKAYPDLPVSIGVIGGDVDESIAGKPRAARIARELFRQPQVESGSHSYTHPYDWGAFQTPVGDLEQEQAKNASQITPGQDPLRAYAKRPFDLKQEVNGALDVVAALSPPAKRPAIYLWSGNTRPFANAIRATRAYGVRNLNGGDSRLDQSYPSIAYLSPLARQVDGERQIYSGMANETIYTVGWQAPFDRFKQLAETIVNTETPRRLKPFNVYYHMYSGERPESLEAVRQHLELARTSSVVPITASQYAAIGDAFFDVRLTVVGRDAWRVTDRGALQTLRFDAAVGVAPDYARSSGLLGHSHHAGSLYVALDPAHAAPVLAIARPGDKPVAVPARPILVSSRWLLSALAPAAAPAATKANCGFEIQAQGFGPGQMTWANMRQGTYTITAVQRGQVLETVEASADGTGRLSFTIKANAIDGVQVSVQCQR